jgi:hypothetical protein
MPDVVAFGQDADKNAKALRTKPTGSLDGLVVAVVDSDGNQISSFGSSVGPTTAAVASVADSASSGTILAANTSRLGASVYNDSSAALYLLHGAGTASATNYTVAIYPNGYYEVPFGYTGELTGVWASDPNDGAARVTEWT